MKFDVRPSAIHSSISLRAPDTVMRLARMGASFPTRLSFMRTLIRRLAAERAAVTRPVWEIDADGFGRAVYSVALGGHVYSLVAYSTCIEPARRTDRVIAEVWDTTYVLHDGVPGDSDLARLEANVPRQEAGRFEARDLVLCRANKSVRMFEHVVERLSQGAQPDTARIGATGYLMRTTAVYGNGKFGIADRQKFAGRPGLSNPFQAEMLTLWLIRGFTHDLVEAIAASRDPKRSVPLDRRLKRHLGVGNSTGLGMAPFLINHPVLLNNWMEARETALARVRSISRADGTTIERVRKLIARARRHLDEWNVEDPHAMNRIVILRREFAEVQAIADSDGLSAPNPWDRLVRASARWSLDCQELIVALLLEPHGGLIDELADGMAGAEEPRLKPSMTTAELRGMVQGHFRWALEVDFQQREESRLFWYYSEEKLEPRLGDRYDEPGAERELPMDIARQVQALDRDLSSAAGGPTVAEFLMRHPEHRHITRRVQSAAHRPYSEIRDNLIGAACLPVDILRCKLSFFGASKFDPKSDRWTRITLFQGAPLFDEIADADADDWWLPVLGAA